MSRLRRLDVPFAQGVNEDVDSTLLPDGALTRLENARFDRAGLLALRRGWRPVDADSVGGTSVSVVDLYSHDGQLVALTSAAGFAVYANADTTQPWVELRQTVVPVTGLRQLGNLPANTDRVVRASAALTADGAFGAVLTRNDAGDTALRVFTTADDATLLYRALSVGTDHTKIVSLGQTFGVVRSTGSAFTLLVIDPLDPVDSAAAAAVTLLTTTSSQFDVATASHLQTAPGALWLSWVDAGAVSAARFTLAGVQVGSTKTVVASAATHSAIATNDTHTHVVYNNGSNALFLLTFDAGSPFTTTVGPTSVVSASVPAMFDVQVDGVANVHVVYQTDDGASDSDVVVHKAYSTAAHAVSHSVSHGGALLVGGIVTGGSATGAVGVARDNASVLLSGSKAGPLWFVRHGEACDVTDGLADEVPPYACAQTPDGEVLVLMRDAEFNPVSYFFRLDFTARRQGVSFNGALHVAGGVLTRVSGVSASEAGLLAPVIAQTASSNGAGALTNSGAYKYRALLRWRDAQRNDVRGEVSVETAVTLGASDDTVTLSVRVPAGLSRSTDLVAGPTLQVYRTEAGPGELFYLTAETTVLSTDFVTVTDTTSDAALISRERLYTEGEFGATSGRLDAVVPRSCEYVAAVRDRLVLGSADEGYQFSQLTLAGEPVDFVDAGVSGPAALVYDQTADGLLTGVAALDDTLLVGTARGWQVVPTAGGGPNYAGQGEFSAPARLPSDVGLYDWRSLLEAADGLWFLGDSDKLFVLPRGQGTPQWAGSLVQAALGGDTVVGAARDTADQVLAWAVAGASPRLVVRDQALGAWSTDPLPFTPRTLVTHDGGLWSVASSNGVVWQQSPTAYGDGSSGATAVVLTAETGDVQTLGLTGWGRAAAVGLRGQFRAAASVACSISYDRGLTWTALGSYSVTGLTAGEYFERQWYPATQRGGAFRLRFTMTPTSTTTEGCRLTGFSLYYTARSGPARLASANRK